MNLIHCSWDIVDEFILRVPDSRCAIEDDKTLRICVAPTIEHCLNAMPRTGQVIRWTRLVGLPVIIHAYYLHSDNVIYDTSKMVGDARFTKEMWILDKPKKVWRIDYEIISCMIRDGKDIYGKDVQLIHSLELKRVPFSDNLKSLADLFNADYSLLKKKCPQMTYRCLALNFDPKQITKDNYNRI